MGFYLKAQHEGKTKYLEKRHESDGKNYKTFLVTDSSKKYVADSYEDEDMNNLLVRSKTIDYFLKNGLDWEIVPESAPTILIENPFSTVEKKETPIFEYIFNAIQTGTINYFRPSYGERYNHEKFTKQRCNGCVTEKPGV
jgi:hypothetical protein